MAQLTIRADDELVARIKRSAAEAGRSMNDYVAFVLDAATNPDFAGTSADRLRERLAAAGLLVIPDPVSGTRPASTAVAAAGRRAARGRSVSSVVADDR